MSKDLRKHRRYTHAILILNKWARSDCVSFRDRPEKNIVKNAESVNDDLGYMTHGSTSGSQARVFPPHQRRPARTLRLVVSAESEYRLTERVSNLEDTDEDIIEKRDPPGECEGVVGEQIAQDAELRGRRHRRPEEGSE
jgi:hypothetical protein